MTGPAGPRVAFLGVAERASLVLEPNTDVTKWNVLGLKHIVLANFFPVSLAGFHFGFALKVGSAGMPIKMRITKESGLEIGTIAMQPTSLSLPGPVNHPDGQLLVEASHGWTTIFFRLGSGAPSVSEPGIILISLQREGESDEIVGALRLVLVDPEPLTDERIASIKSDPGAVKSILLELGCRLCSSKYRVYAALEENDKQKQDGYVWYRDVPDSVACECKNTTHDLSSIRRNLFAPLGQPLGRFNESVGVVPLYEKGALETLHSDLLSLFDTKPPEELLQKFIEKNPILLHQFPSLKLYFKPPILTFFKADFALVTPQKELILIEIENTETRLLKKDGGEAGPLRHAFDQVHSWLHVIDEHRLAVLESLKIARDTVGAVRGVVIAGRDRGYDAEHLRRLKSADRGRVTFLTFDDLASGLNALIHKVGNL